VGSATHALQVAEPLQGGQHLAAELQDFGGLEVGDVVRIGLGLGGPEALALPPCQPNLRKEGDPGLLGHPRRLSAQGARFVATYSLLVRQGLEVLAGVMADETDDAGQPLTDKSLAAFTEDAENFMLATWGIPKPPAWWRDQDWDYPTQSEHTG